MGKGRKVRKVKSNIADNESTKMTTSKGALQGTLVLPRRIRNTKSLLMHRPLAKDRNTPHSNPC